MAVDVLLGFLLLRHAVRHLLAVLHFHTDGFIALPASILEFVAGLAYCHGQIPLGTAKPLGAWVQPWGPIIDLTFL
jgi:hypothetical protein